MKIFKAKEGYILVNRETGGAGSTVYSPDTVDDYLWAQIPITEYNKWINKDNQSKIYEEIKSQLISAMTVKEISNLSDDEISDDNQEINTIVQDIDPTKINIVLSDNVYTFKQMFASINSTLCNDIDVTDTIIIDIYNQLKHN